MVKSIPAKIVMVYPIVDWTQQSTEVCVATILYRGSQVTNRTKQIVTAARK